MKEGKLEELVAKVLGLDMAQQNKTVTIILHSISEQYKETDEKIERQYSMYIEQFLKKVDKVIRSLDEAKRLSY